MCLVVILSISSGSPQLFRADADDAKLGKTPEKAASREGKSLNLDPVSSDTKPIAAVETRETESVVVAREGKAITNEVVSTNTNVAVITPQITQAVSTPAFTAFSSNNLVNAPVAQAPVVQASTALLPQAPTYHTPTIHAAPAYRAPAVHTAPASRASVVHAAPAYRAPVIHAAPAFRAPVVHAAPAYHAPVFHAAPAYSAPVVNAAPAYRSPVVHAAPAYHTQVVHAAPAYHASVLHAPVVHASPTYHAPPAYHAPVVYAAPAYHAQVVHAAPSYHTPIVHAAQAYHAPVTKSYVEPTYPNEPSPYTYTYAVADDYSNAAFNAGETGDGAGNAAGSYSVALPDGRTQHVNYKADGYEGYVADVTYEGTAAYPIPATPVVQNAPAYHPQPVAYAG
jgi:hypothetical protein